MKKVVTFLLILIICIEVNAQSCKVFIGNSVDSINTIVSKIEIAIHSKFINKTKNNNGYSFSDDKGNELQINGEDEIEKVIVNCADAKIRVAFYNLLKQQASTCPNYQMIEKPFESIMFNNRSRLYLKGSNVYIVK